MEHEDEVSVSPPEPSSAGQPGDSVSVTFTKAQGTPEMTRVTAAGMVVIAPGDASGTCSAESGALLQASVEIANAHAGDTALINVTNTTPSAMELRVPSGAIGATGFYELRVRS